MPMERLHFETRDEWLAHRNGIGGSDAASIVGLSPWMTASDLFEIKTGRKAQKDISDDANVRRGVMMEPVLRDFYAARHPEMSVEHYPYDILYQTERPWLFATLDGELTERESGKHGILEIKSSMPQGKVGWDKWSNGNIPPNYFCQCLHQLLATGWDFVILLAGLESFTNGDVTVREYRLDREDYTESDLPWLLDKETTFWSSIKRGIMPPVTLTI